MGLPLCLFRRFSCRGGIVQRCANSSHVQPVVLVVVAADIARRYCTAGKVLKSS